MKKGMGKIGVLLKFVLWGGCKKKGVELNKCKFFFET